MNLVSFILNPTFSGESRLRHVHLLIHNIITDRAQCAPVSLSSSSQQHMKHVSTLYKYSCQLGKYVFVATTGSTLAVRVRIVRHGLPYHRLVALSVPVQ